MADVLDAFDSATLDASGRGVVSLAPESFRVWTVTTINVRTSQEPADTPVPQCTIYLGAIGGSIVSQTYMGNRATAGGSPLVVQPSQPLIFVWENGIPGTTAAAYVYGSMSMR